MMKKIVLALVVASLLVSCSTLKINSLLKKGEVDKATFKVEIPFEYRFGLIILKVEIDGKVYDFLLDTGAPNLVSNELAAKLTLKPVVSQKIEDSQNNSSRLDFVTVDKINIGGLNFCNTAAFIASLKEPNEISCLKIDGIIGANLMRKAIWYIDYENQKIIISNTIDSFTIPADSKIIHFTQSDQGTPFVRVKVNGELIKDIEFDTGSNHDFNLSEKNYRKMNQKKLFTSSTFAYGSQSSGLYGAGNNDTTFIALASSFTLDELVLHNQIINYRGHDDRIGTKFFKNYNVIINWNKEEITMIQTKEYDNKIETSFGFTPIIKGEKVFVRLIYNNSSADKAGLKLGDQIIEVNGKDYNAVSWSCWCQIRENGIADDLDAVSLTVLRNGQKLSFNLKKSTVF